MSQPHRICALHLPELGRAKLNPDIQKYFAKCDEKLGFVSNVLRAYSFNSDKLANFMTMYNELMLGPSGVSKLEREMIAVVASSINHWFLLPDRPRRRGAPAFGRSQTGRVDGDELSCRRVGTRQRAMLDFAAKFTETPDKIVETDRQALRDAGFSDADSRDIAAVTHFSICPTGWRRRRT